MVVVTVASDDGATLKVGSATPSFTSFKPVLAAICSAAPSSTAASGSASGVLRCAFSLQVLDRGHQCGRGERAERDTTDARPVGIGLAKRKREAADAFYRHFSQLQQPTLAAPASLVPAEPIAQPDTPPAGAPPAEWLRYHQ